jgi:5-methyltetrahydrofolate--homocysteine methyltransferase
MGAADALLLETLCSWPPDPGTITRQSVWNPNELPLLLSFTYECSARTQRQIVPEPEIVADTAVRWGAAALGVNCGRDIGMDEIIAITRRYRQATDLPLFARPNAGTPVKAEGRWVYPHTPEKLAGRLTELLEAGVRLVGGCCGTTPEHIAAFHTILSEWNAPG